jgi:hypothetical protein
MPKRYEIHCLMLHAPLGNSGKSGVRLYDPTTGRHDGEALSITPHVMGKAVSGYLVIPKDPAGFGDFFVPVTNVQWAALRDLDEVEKMRADAKAKAEAAEKARQEELAAMEELNAAMDGDGK